MIRMLIFSLVFFISSTATAQWSMDTYIHGGEMTATEGQRTDSARFLSLFSFGATYYPIEEIGIRGAFGSVMGLVIPSLEVNLAAEYYPLNGKFSPLLRLGGRYIINVGIECSNNDASCKTLADQHRNEKPAADALGPLLAGYAAELGLGAQYKFGRMSIAGWGSYLVGPLNTEAGGKILSKNIYQGWLGSVAFRYHFQPGR